MRGLGRRAVRTLLLNSKMQQAVALELASRARDAGIRLAMRSSRIPTLHRGLSTTPQGTCCMSSCSGSTDGVARTLPFIDFGKKKKTVYRSEERITGVPALAFKEGHHPPKGFGSAFQDGYDITDPCLVDAISSAQQVSGDADVLQRLKQGFIRFKHERFLKETELFSKLATGQQPKVMIIACCDSRVCPTMLMGLEPGEVFSFRNVANLVPPFEKEGKYHGTSAALEFAVTGLQVEHIIVLGHRACGGIKALMSRSESDIGSDFIGSWMSVAIPARDVTLEVMSDEPFDEQCRYCEQESINVSLANLLTFPWLEERFKLGRLGLHGWYYDFVEGSMTSWAVQPSSSSPSNHHIPENLPSVAN